MSTKTSSNISSTTSTEEKTINNIPFKSNGSDAGNDSTNSIFHGNYKIIQSIGRGRGSMVYHAQTIPGKKFKTIKDVALKVLIGSSKNPLMNQERMKREAVAMLSARSKNVIQLFDFVSAEGHHYLSMEYASFKDLGYQLTKRKKPFEIDLALLMTAQILNGLEAIHAAGIIHRDIKPENLLLTGEGQIKVADFGIAHIPAEQLPLEEAQRGVGTFDYLAPEILESGVCDISTDIYATGVSVFELLTGETPFKGKSVAKSMDDKISGNLPKLSKFIDGAPESLENLVSKAMAADPSKRFQSASEFKAEAIKVRNDIAKLSKSSKKKIIVKNKKQEKKNLNEKLEVSSAKSDSKKSLIQKTPAVSSLDSFMSKEKKKYSFGQKAPQESIVSEKVETPALDKKQVLELKESSTKESTNSKLNIKLNQQSFNHSTLATSTLPEDKLGLKGKLYLLKRKVIKGGFLVGGVLILTWLLGSFALKTASSLSLDSLSLSSFTPSLSSKVDNTAELSQIQIKSGKGTLNSFFAKGKNLNFKVKSIRDKVYLKFMLPGNPVTEFSKEEFLSSKTHDINLNGLKLSLNLEGKGSHKNEIIGSFQDNFTKQTGTFSIR